MLKLENITKYYYSSTSVTCALRKINLEFKLGEFVAITGESGSGKTTLLNLISGLDSYEDGEMYYYDKKTSYFDDDDWEKYRKNEIAFIFQNYNLIDSYTVLENVAVTYIIDGYSYSKAKEKAKEVLKLVGLENDAFKKASKLSGGQKQRLSIARALAKETNIIVADEPTGNLDSENGIQILELLKKLSKDKLVIVVTHNLAQIEPYITRKIRLHDGEVVVNETVEELNKDIQLVQKEEKSQKSIKKIFNFGLLNIKSQPRKVILLMLIILINVLASFIFYANFKVNLDEHKTKKTTQDIFTNLDDTRLLVKKKDNSPITNEIMEEAMVENVVSYEKYDYIGDINYFRPSDYKKNILGAIGDIPNGTQFFDSSFIELVDHSHFMKSYTNLKEEMLRCGRLPDNDFEMVVYSNDDSILNTEELVLFRNDKLWGIDSWYQYKVKIVGILKEPTEQAYFSENICKILDLSRITIEVSIIYKNKDDKHSNPLSSIDINKIVIDPNLTNRELSVPEKTFAFFNDPSREIVNRDNLLFKNQSEGKSQYFLTSPNLSAPCSVAKDAVGVSKEIFYEIYDSIKDSTQFAIYIKDYAHTDDVINTLINKEFESLSCFKASVTGYDSVKVTNRYVNLLISVVGLIGINAISILLCYTILKLKKNDYVIFKMIGLTNNIATKINYFEVFVYGIVSFIIMVITTIIVKNTTTIGIVLEVFKYIKWFDYLILFIMIFISMLILSSLFGKFLTKKVSVTVLKED